MPGMEERCDVLNSATALGLKWLLAIGGTIGLGIHVVTDTNVSLVVAGLMLCACKVLQNAK